MSNVPADLLYTKDHEFVAKTSDPTIIRVGITDYAQGELGDIVFVNLPKKGDTFAALRAVSLVRKWIGPIQPVQITDGQLLFCNCPRFPNARHLHVSQEVGSTSLEFL